MPESTGSPLSRGRRRENLLLHCRQQVRQRGAQPLRIVVAEAERAVAFGAEQPAHAAGHMAVVDAKNTRRLAADRAGIALSRLQRAILRKRKPVTAGTLAVAIVGLQRPAYAAAVVLRKR